MRDLCERFDVDIRFRRLFMVEAVAESVDDLLELRSAFVGNVVSLERDSVSPERDVRHHVGRLAVEKNLDAFLALPLPGTKLVIGDGPERAALEFRYPQVRFAGYRFGSELAALLSGADVLVFASSTDTFGLVMVEALACGVPVAAFPVPGPLDVIEAGVTGVLHEDLARAIAGLAPIPLPLRARVAVSRSSAMIARVAARWQASGAGDAN